jgi:hypothetical protein
VAEGSVRSLLFEFQETKDGELEKGLDAPACQFVRLAPISLGPSVPASKFLIAQMDALISYI